MVKERKFAVHPNALSCLLQLRLKSELGGIRASETKTDKESSSMVKWESRGKADRRRAKGKKVGRPHMSKKAVKALKDKMEIEGQMREAEAEADREEKANMVCPALIDQTPPSNARSSAYGDSQARLCALFPNFKSLPLDATPYPCITGYISICTSGEH